MGIQHISRIVEALSRCIHACEHCVASGKGLETSASARHCVAACLDTVETCSLLLKMISRDSEHWWRLIPLCAGVCRDCEAACHRHSGGYCPQCAQACRECAEACDAYALPMAA